MEGIGAGFRIQGFGLPETKYDRVRGQTTMNTQETAFQANTQNT